MKIKNLSETKCELYVYGEIVGEEWDKVQDTDTCPQDVIDMLKQTEGKELDIYVNSPGGSVFAGLAIYNLLCRKKEKKVCYVDGVAASIASVIAMAGDEIFMPENSFLMIHKPSGFVVGNAADMRKMADDLERIQTGIEQVYQTKLQEGHSIEEIKNFMEKETWFSAKEAAEYFQVTVTKQEKISAKWDLRAYQNVPKSLLQEEKTEQEEKIEIEKELFLLQNELELWTGKDEEL